MSLYLAAMASVDLHQPEYHLQFIRVDLATEEVGGRSLHISKYVTPANNPKCQAVPVLYTRIVFH